ncbi:hypothetical protein AJ80_05425 [Polytolypa hystricis UAMH7299]|uniref:Uncharacterized protein n=1 Tax=Polytolypa hystricis (strain UAMH7299) TaxID=1447883 RepID=A0A2B7Y4W1_POLH7|nr:hypothetical protein AJ80_05425 [Polytolypa hystricis UAMH7299]
MEKNGLYILLSNTGEATKYHWGILIATNSTSGILFHQALIGTHWTYVVENEEISKSPDVLGALKVGVVEGVEDEWIDAIKTCLREVTVHEEFTFRTWLLAGLYELASQGYIGLMPDWPTIREIEQEAKDLAADAYYKRHRPILMSRWYRA